MVSFAQNKQFDVPTDFPQNIKLCYENITHNKVYDADYVIPIAEGKKTIAWFTLSASKPVCLLMNVNEKQEIYNCFPHLAIFDESLCNDNGTIVYGTTFIHKSAKYFQIEDILYYKGLDLKDNFLVKKLEILTSMFKSEISQIAYNSKFVVFGMPLMNTNFMGLIKQIQNLPYPVKYIQYRYVMKKTDTFSCVKYMKPRLETMTLQSPVFEMPKQKIAILNSDKRESIFSRDNKSNVELPQAKKYKNQKDVIFKVKADVQNDIYFLYTCDSTSPYSTAYISDYKTSVFMNKLFRNIKENDNLDALEESDDEDEFQSENVAKFVDLNKEYNMVCRFNHRFKKWSPVEISKTLHIVHSEELLTIKK